MHYEIIVPPNMAEELRAHLLTDRSREHMGVMLCGVHRSSERVRLIGRHLVLLPPEAFARQSAVGLEVEPAVQRVLLQRAAQEGLSQVDFHTHPGDGAAVHFSGIDDRNEAALAGYLADRLPGTLYASVVMNSSAAAARVWEVTDHAIVSTDASAPNLDGQLRPSPNANGMNSLTIDTARFDRQVRAFGPAFQQQLSGLRVGLVGLGGLGSVIAEQLTRLGVRRWRLVDPDVVATTNLNRLLGAAPEDAAEERSKVKVAARSIRRIDPDAEVRTLRCSVFTERALRALCECDLLVAATDDDASRLTLNALACQYLIPLVHAGVNLDAVDAGRFADISGEVALPALGTWCLLCGGIVDSQRASWDVARPEERELLQGRGYLPGTPAPAVYHLNAIVASLAVTEIHNLVAPYKELRRYLMYRELDAELMPVEVPSPAHCLHCRPEGLLGLGDLAPLWRPRSRQSALPAVLPEAADEEGDAPLDE